MDSMNIPICSSRLRMHCTNWRRNRRVVILNGNRPFFHCVSIRFLVLIAVLQQEYNNLMNAMK